MSARFLHLAIVGEVPIRFFRSPINDGRPDLPWCAMADILFASGHPKEVRARMAVEISKDFRDRIRSVDFDGRPLVIGALRLARDVLGGAVQRRVAHPSILNDMNDATTAAIEKLARQLGAAVTADYLVLAGQRWPTMEPAA